MSWHQWRACLLLCLGCLLPNLVVAKFDHFTTGFPLNGVHAQTSCDGCHAQGVFRGTTGSAQKGNRKEIVSLLPR